MMKTEKITEELRCNNKISEKFLQHVESVELAYKENSGRRLTRRWTRKSLLMLV